MTTTPVVPFPVTPRRPGDPVPDLTGFELIHRALKSGTAVLADAFSELTAAGAVLEPVRHREIKRFARHVLAELHSHHVKEDDVLWPVIAVSAGPHIDLEPLTDDHTDLQRLLDQAQDALTVFTGDWRAGAAELDRVFTQLRVDLAEHIADEEATVFPVMLEYVSREDFARCETKFRKGASFTHLRFVLPWVVDQTTPAERTELLRAAPLPVRLVLAASQRRWLRRLDIVRG